MNLTIRQLRYICTVADQGSILAASRCSNISQSSILAAIGLAEAEMGAAIFDRKPARGISITPAGERFISAARTMLAAGTEFSRSIGNLSERFPKVLRIGCFEPFGALFMPEVLRIYADTVGDVEFNLLEGDQEQLNDWLTKGLIDVAIMYDIGRVSSESITRICRVPAHAVLSADDPLAKGGGVWLADLATRPLVLLDLPQTSTYLLTLFDVLAKRPEVRFRTRSYETVRSAVASRFGISILNMRPIGRATTDGHGIVRKPILDDLPAPTLIVVDMYTVGKPLYLRVFIEVFKSFFAQLPPSAFSVTTPDREATLII